MKINKHSFIINQKSLDFMVYIDDIVIAKA
jgi:hypothetical protein